MGFGGRSVVMEEIARVSRRVLCVIIIENDELRLFTVRKCQGLWFAKIMF